MNFFASLLMFLGGLIVLNVLFGVARLVTRGRGGYIANMLVPGLVLVLMVVAGSVYIDNNGDIVQGLVEAKNEQIINYDTGTYARFLDVDVNFKPSGAQLATTVRLPVDGPLFDQVHQGETVDIRYLNPLGLFIFSRFKQQSTFSLIPWGTVWPAFLVICLAGLVYLWFRKPRPKAQDVVEPTSEADSESVAPPTFRRLIVFILFVVWLGVVSFTLFLPALTRPSIDTWQTATAHVTSSRRYTEVTQSLRSSRNIPLIQPFDMIQFTFTPQGMTDPVTGVDVIDEEPLGLPDNGTSLTIKYPAADPRAAVIPGSTYTHLWKNPLGGLAIFLGIIIGLWLVYWLLRMVPRVLGWGLKSMVTRR